MNIDNSFVYVWKDEVDEDVYNDIIEKCTYKDLGVDFQINLLKKGRWVNLKKIKELEKVLFVTICADLVYEGKKVLLIPQGLLEYPTLKPIFDKLKREDNRSPLKYNQRFWNKEPFQMRYYQKEAVDEVVKFHRGQIVASTGSGKTLMIANLIQKIDCQTIVIAPTTLIAEQLYIFLVECFSIHKVGFFGDGKKQIKNITVCLYQSLIKAFASEEFSKKIKETQMVICDENQILGSQSLVAIGIHLRDVPLFYSFSATNFRSDGKTIEIYAQSGVERYSFDTKRAIEEKFLSTPFFVVKKIESTNDVQAKLKHHNYVNHILDNNLFKEQLLKDIKKYMELETKPQILILVSEIEHGLWLQKTLNIDYIYGDTKNPMDYIDKFNSGEIKYLIGGSSLCGVGTDFRPVNVLFLLSFVVSEGLVMQLLGRGLRRTSTKGVVVVHDYDLIDCDQLSSHTRKRIELYKKFGTVKII